MTTAVRLAAVEAWRQMWESHLPAGVALDVVQEQGIDRDDAVSELLQAASDWLDPKLAEIAWWRPEAEAVVRSVAAEDFRFAEAILRNLRARGEARSFVPEWCDRAAMCLALCRSACAAAWPE